MSERTNARLRSAWAVKGVAPATVVIALLVALRSPAEAQSCTQLSGVFSATLTGSTSGTSSDSGSCGGADAPEATYVYVTPRAGIYRIDTIGSSFDTVLYVRNDSGSELGCNDDISPASIQQSRVTLALAAGQMIAVTVDGFESASGSFTLRINGECPQPLLDDPRDLGSGLAVMVNGTTACGSNLIGDASCGEGGAAAPDATFIYSAPVAGTYVISTAGSAFDTVLSVRSFACSGAELACNDDIMPGSNVQSRVTLFLEQGVRIIVVVDGFQTNSGAFALQISGTPAPPTATRTQTGTRTPTRTPTITPTRTATPTRTMTATRAPTRTPTLTRSATPTRTATPSRTPTRSRTPTATASHTRSATATRTLTGAPTATATATAIASTTATTSATPTLTLTPNPTPSPTPTGVPSPTTSALPTPTATFTPLPVGAPSGLRCEARLVTPGWLIRLEWSDTALGESELHIERAPDGVTWAEVATTGANVTSYQDGILPASMTFHYRVRAHRHGDGVFSAYADAVSCTTLAPTPPLTATPTVTPTLECGGPSGRPEVQLAEPPDATGVLSSDLPQLSGTVLASAPAQLIVQVESMSTGDSYGVDITDYVLADSQQPGVFTFALDDAALFAGANRVTVRVADAACPSTTGQAFIDTVFMPPPADLNVYVLGMEVTQATQGDERWDGVASPEPVVKRSSTALEPIPYQFPGARDGVPLVAHKRTMVRVYGALDDSTTTAVAGVGARLFGIGHSGPLPGSPLSAAPITLDAADQTRNLDGTLSVPRTLQRKRRGLDKSWNFILPDSWTLDTSLESEPPQLTVQLNPPDFVGPIECAGCDDEANRMTVFNVQFAKTAALTFRTFYLAQDADVAAMPGADMRTFCGTFLRSYPVRDGCGTGVLSTNDFAFGINLLSLTRLDPTLNKLVGADGRSVITGATQGLMCDLMYRDGVRPLPAFTPPAAYFGMVPSGVPVADFPGFGGPNTAFLFPSACSSGIESGAAVAAQEVGHGTLGRDENGADFGITWHAPCGSPPDPLPSFPLYPMPGGVGFPFGSIGQFGVDTSVPQVFDPSTTFDFMSYCAPTWVSPFTYRILYRHFRDRLVIDAPIAASEADAAHGAGEREYLFASGAVDPDDRAHVRPFYREFLPAGTADEMGQGEYSLELHDEQSQRLFVRRFDLDPAATHNPSGTRPPQPPLAPRFREVVPWDPAAAEIVLKHGDSVLEARAVSANIPVVTVRTPNGDEAWGENERQIIQWSADDADGDALSYLVQYSIDAGATWRTLASDITETLVVTDTAFLPGSNAARVRVLATDGVNTGRDQSDATFAVAKKDPTIWITGIEDNALVRLGSVLNLIANYSDADEESLAEDEIVWRSDRAGVLGTGSRLELPAAQLSPGPHQLSLTVPGEDGQPITTRVTVLRSPRLDEIQPACAGDCSPDRAVTVDELILAVNIALGNSSVSLCALIDGNHDGSVTVDELIAAVNRALGGCPES